MNTTTTRLSCIYDNVNDVLKNYGITVEDVAPYIDDKVLRAWQGDWDTDADYWQELSDKTVQMRRSRHVRKYVLDISIGWIREIVAERKLVDAGVEYEINSGEIDNNRVRRILIGNKITSDADIKMASKSGKPIHMDVTGDSTGYIAKHGRVDFKAAKIKHMRSIVNNGGIAMIWIHDTINSRMCLMQVGRYILDNADALAIDHKYYNRVVQVDCKDLKWVAMDASMEDLRQHAYNIVDTVCND